MILQRSLYQSDTGKCSCAFDLAKILLQEHIRIKTWEVLALVHATETLDKAKLFRLYAVDMVAKLNWTSEKYDLDERKLVAYILSLEAYSIRYLLLGLPLLRFAFSI